MIHKDSKPIKRLVKNFFKLLFLVKIEGLSLFPNLVPGRLYLASKLSKIKKNDYVIFLYKNKILVKRVLSIEGVNILLTDNLNKKFMITSEEVIGKILLRVF